MRLRRRELFGLALGGGASLLVPASALAQPRHKSTFNVVPINVDRVFVDEGQLVANFLVGRHPVQQVLGVSARPNQLDPTCPILDLEIGAIHLDLLGLIVDTSDICLSVTAIPGGGLLGDLLCGIANLLNGGTPLADILAGLTGAQLALLLTGLTNLLNQILGGATANTALAGVSGTQAGACDILNLALGPVDLTLLGLNVHVDDCAGGPVTVDITANPAGGLLGSLLCALANLLSGGAAAVAISALLFRIAQVIGDLLNA